MNTVRRHHRFASWLAFVAIAAMALLPALTQALTRSGTGLVEVCTPQGMKIVALADGQTLPSGAALHLEHCPYCTLGGPAGLAPAEALLVVPAAASEVAPPQSLPVPRPRLAWTAASPRAPPPHA